MSYRDKLRKSTDPLIAGARRSSSHRGRRYQRTKGMADYFRLEGHWKEIRLINGEYTQSVFNTHTGEIVEDTLPYIEIYQHWDPQGYRSHLCSAGINEFSPEPCVGCTIQDGRRSTSRVFTIIHLAHYHKVPFVKDNKIVRKKDGEVVMIDKECEGNNCKMCASGDEKFFGKRLHMKLGLQHFGQLVAKASDLNEGCKCGGEIIESQFICPHCESMLIDMGDPDCTMTDREVYNARDNGMHCQKCGYLVDLLALPSCTSCEDPEPVTIFDVNTFVRKMGSGNSKDKRTILDVKFSSPCDLPEEYEGETEPMDLKAIFTPKPIPDQMRDWNFRGEVTNAKSNETEDYQGD